MKTLRVALVTARFWPLASENASLVAFLAEALRARGHIPQIVTPQRHSSWPPFVVHRETPVHRIGPPPQGEWDVWRYVRALVRWWRAQAADLDLVYSFGMGLEAYAAVTALQPLQLPMLVRPSAAGAAGECQWFARNQRGRLVQRRLRHAQRVVVANGVQRQEASAAGFSTAQIRLIPDGVPAFPTRPEEARGLVRQALADINRDLGVPDYAPVAVYVGPLQRDRNLHELIDAWDRVVAAWPSANLWLIGDGPERRALYEHTGDLGIRAQVRMPGTFDDLEDVLAATDVLVQPSYLPHPQVSVLQAMRARVPVVLADTPLHRELIGTPPRGFLFQVGSVASLEQALREPIDNPELARELAGRAGQFADEHFAMEQMADAHLRLFEEVLAEVGRS